MTDNQRLYNRIDFLLAVLDDAVYEAESSESGNSLDDALPAFATLLDASMEHLQRLGYSPKMFGIGDV